MVTIFSTITSTTFGVVFLSSISLPTVIPPQMEPILKIKLVLIPKKIRWLLHFNIRSLKSHYDELLLFLISLKVKPTVIALTETWLNGIDHLESMSFPGFSKSIAKNQRTRGGGIGLLVFECASKWKPQWKPLKCLSPMKISDSSFCLSIGLLTRRLPISLRSLTH